MTASTVHRLVLLSVCGRYSTNWDQKSWPGSEIQIYSGCPWNINWYFHKFYRKIFYLKEIFLNENFRIMIFQNKKNQTRYKPIYFVIRLPLSSTLPPLTLRPAPGPKTPTFSWISHSLPIISIQFIQHSSFYIQHILESFVIWYPRS